MSLPKNITLRQDKSKGQTNIKFMVIPVDDMWILFRFRDKVRTRVIIWLSVRVRVEVMVTVRARVRFEYA